MADLSYLTEVCNTEYQRAIVGMFVAGKTGPEIASAMGMNHRSGPDTIIRRLKKRAARLGLAPGHFDHGEAIHDACVQLGREMGSVGPADPAFDRAFDQMQEARQMAQEKVRTAIPNPFAVVHDLQAAAKKHPDLQGLCDRAITVVLVYGDKIAAARAALDDVVVK